jgi:hypothetical protein
MSESNEGEVLKASGLGQSQINVGMEVTTLDGQQIGKVKEVHDDEFLVDRPFERNLWVPFSAVMATEEYTGNYRGGSVVLSVSGAHVDTQGWRHA